MVSQLGVSRMHEGINDISVVFSHLYHSFDGYVISLALISTNSSDIDSDTDRASVNVSTQDQDHLGLDLDWIC